MHILEMLGRVGFRYEVEVVRAGVVIDREAVENIIPAEGLNDFLNVYFAGGTQHAQWYVGIFEGNYTPLATDTAANFPTRATESTAYNEAARPLWANDAVTNGNIVNSTTRATFTLSAAKTIYGAFLTPVSTKNATTGILVSAAKFANPKVLDVGDQLNVLAGLTLTSN